MKMRLDPHDIVFIKRTRKYELDMSISDHLARGFTLLQRGEYKKSPYSKLTYYWAKIQVN